MSCSCQESNPSAALILVAIPTQLSRLPIEHTTRAGWNRKGPVSESAPAVTPSRGRVTTNCQTPPLVEDEAPFQNT
jgi:hypothetical protein